MFSLRFQVNYLTVTNFELQFPASVPVCGAERRCVLVSISALYYRIHRVRGLSLMGAVASCVVSSSSSNQLKIGHGSVHIVSSSSFTVLLRLISMQRVGIKERT